MELQHNAIVAARAAGVTHIVKVSAFAATDHSKAPIGQWHYQIEKELQESGIGWTMLQPHHFMTNLVAQAEYVIKEGAIYSPSGDGKIPYVDPRDVAAVAFVTLTQGHSQLSDSNQFMHFMKNMAIVGGSLAFVAFGAGACSLDARTVASTRHRAA